MCTASWIHSNEGYSLFFNRDEKLTRREGLPPELRELRGVKYISPLDGDHQGTWIAVNQFGLTLCLLNRYQMARSNTGVDFTSRGLLLINLIDSVGQVEIENRLAHSNLQYFQPFTLAVLQQRSETVVFQWDGLELLKHPKGDALMPLTSSSCDTLNVIERRRSQFEKFRDKAGELNEETLYRFHHSHDPSSGANSVCMHRDDAATVSFSTVRVDDGSIEFGYLQASPCMERRDAIHAIRLERAAS